MVDWLRRAASEPFAACGYIFSALVALGAVFWILLALALPLLPIIFR